MTKTDCTCISIPSKDKKKDLMEFPVYNNNSFSFSFFIECRLTVKYFYWSLMSVQK